MFGSPPKLTPFFWTLNKKLDPPAKKKCGPPPPKNGSQNKFKKLEPQFFLDTKNKIIINWTPPQKNKKIVPQHVFGRQKIK